MILPHRDHLHTNFHDYEECVRKYRNATIIEMGSVAAVGLIMIVVYLCWVAA